MTTDVPFVALGRTHAPLEGQLAAAFARVVGSSGFILGEEVARFEEEFAVACGAAHCVGVASGTAALTLALMAAGIGPGDEVVVPAHTFIASALGVVHAGAEPVFCDVDEGTGLIDPAAAAAAVGPRTAALLGVHLYGQACDVPALRAIAAPHGLLVVEDAAQAHGATFAGAPAGSLGDAGCFSFYPSKNLGALGDGGAICTDDLRIAERARRLRHLGQRAKGEHLEIGFNERLDGLQAALLRVKLPHLAAGNAARRAHAERYRERLDGLVGLLVERAESPSVHHLFPVRHPARDELAGRLGALGVQTGVHYAPTVPAHPAFGARAEGAFPAAEAWAREELSLPMFPELRDDEAERVCAAVATAAEELATVAYSVS